MALTPHSSEPLASPGGTVFGAYLAGHPAITPYLGVLPKGPSDLATNLEPLRKRFPNAVPRIVTGHQPQWCLGPAYVYLKALTVQHLASDLSTSLRTPVKPTFWSHTDDSDTSEVDNLHAINSNFDVQRFSLGLQASRKILYRQAITSRSLTVFETLVENLAETPHKQSIAESFRLPLSNETATFAQQFESLLRVVFSDANFEIVEPRQDRPACAHAVSLFLTNLERCIGLWKQLDTTLEQHDLPSPFRPLEAPLFFLLDDSSVRHPVRYRDATFLLDATPISTDRLQERIHTNPKASSPAPCSASSPRA